MRVNLHKKYVYIPHGYELLTVAMAGGGETYNGGSSKGESGGGTAEMGAIRRSRDLALVR